jgi:copper resistance protein D
MPDAAGLLQLGGTLLLNIALACLVAAVASAMGHWQVWGAQGPAAGWGQRAQVAGAVLALVGHALLLWWQAAAMAELPLADAWAALGPVLLGTHYGRAWWVGAAALACLLALGLGAGAAARSRAAALWTALGVAVFAASRSAVGHASGGEFGLYALVDWAHLLLVSLWVGEVWLALVWMTRQRPGDPHLDPGQAARCVVSLSTTATWALAGVGITAALLSWNGLGAQPQALVSSAYGWVLLAKLGLVAAAVGLGAYNRWVHMPALLAGLAATPSQARAPWARFAAVLRVEAVLLLAVLLAAAVLATRAPPGA